jgi:hypothetical protein
MVHQEGRITLRVGNIRNYYLRLGSILEMFPPDAIGGSSKAEPGLAILVHFKPGSSAETDIDGGKLMFRNRSAVREFFESSAAVVGDVVVIEKLSERTFNIHLES